MKKLLLTMVVLAIFVSVYGIASAAQPPTQYEWRVREECRDDADGGNTMVIDYQVYPGQDPLYPCGATVIVTERAMDHYVITERRTVVYDDLWNPVFGEWELVAEFFTGPCEYTSQVDIEAWVCENNPYAFDSPTFTFCQIEGSENWPTDLTLNLYGNEVVRRKESGAYEVAPFDWVQFPVGSQMPLTLSGGQPYTVVTYEGQNVCSIIEP